MPSWLEFVCTQSLQGHHHLFDDGLLRRALASPPLDVPPEIAEATLELFERLEGTPTIAAQRARIEEAAPAVQELFVWLYFEFLERYRRQVRGTIH